MIPASYLFKTVYQQAWEEPEPAVTPNPQPSFISGLMTPLTGALEAIWTPRSKPAHLHGRRHAYE